jgi:hypothetical protein
MKQDKNQQTLLSVVKLSTYRPPNIPISLEERQAIQKVIVDFVHAVWKLYHRPTDETEIYYGMYEGEGEKRRKILSGVRDRIECLIEKDEWTFHSYPPIKRTVDRRVNEAASEEFGAQIVCVNPRIYMPNPQLFPQDKK